MLSATITVRELKNKDTGLDLSIPRWKEVPGLLASSFEYQVVVVSCLPFFKSPKHKESDVVQFMVPRKFRDFEELHTKMNEQHSTTVLPLIPRKTLIVNSTVAKYRKASLENFLKFLAVTPKLCTSPHLLQFLGVNAIKAGAYRKQSEKSNSDGQPGIADTVSQPGIAEEGEMEKNDDVEKDTSNEPEDLFEEDEEENDTYLFTADDKDVKNISGELMEESEGQQEMKDAMLFDTEDLGGNFDFEKNQDVFVHGFVEEIPSQPLIAAEEDDNSELLKIEDDLDKLLQLSTKANELEPTKVSVPENRPKPAPRRKSALNKQDPQHKDSQSDGGDLFTEEFDTAQLSPLAQPKPAPRSRPVVMPIPRSKPALANKPPIGLKPQTSDKNKDNKVLVSPKPKTSDKNTDDEILQTFEERKGENSDELSSDDISKYIQENLSSDADLDLFS